MGVQNKLCIGKVADTGYSREERERRREGGARKSGGTHATGYMHACVERIGGDIEEEKVRAGKDAEIIGLSKLF